MERDKRKGRCSGYRPQGLRVLHPWCTHWQAVIEKMGIPTVGLVGNPFIEDARTSAFSEGLRLRDVVLVQPFTETGEAAVKKAQSVMDKIVKGLTAPLTEEEKKTGLYEPPRPPRIAVRGTLEKEQD